jgi:hypothetical protein
MVTVMTCATLALATLMVVTVVVVVEAIMDREVGTIAIRMVHSGAT